jgi:hypothetical protein
MADPTDVSQQPSAGLNRPTSGDYGEGAALDRLKSALPTQPAAGGGAPPGGAPPLPPISTQPVTPTPMDRGGRPNNSAALPPGVPPVLAAPTNQPNVPVGTPLAMPPVNPVASAQTPQQSRLALLDALANSPQADPQTREWAQHVIRALLTPG